MHRKCYLYLIIIEITVIKLADERRKENYISVDFLHSDSIRQRSLKTTEVNFNCCNY